MSARVFKLSELRLVQADDRTYPVVEIFGPTIQGEGALAGTVSHFIRFGGCDYACDWCDSAPAVLPEEVRTKPKLYRADILDRIEALPHAEWVTLSGGNPALHELVELVAALKLMGFKVAVETQGSKWQQWLEDVDQLTISPKPPSSGMDGRLHPRLAEYIKDFHWNYSTRLNLKVPVFDRRDFEWATLVHLQWPNIPFYLSVVTRMGGLRGDFDGGTIDTTDDILARYRQVIDWTLAESDMYNVRVIPQLHALVWGHERGH